MSASAYRDHPLRSLVSRILEMQSTPELADPSVSHNETYSFARDKVFALTHLIHALLEATPAELASNHALNQINTHLQSTANELSAFQADKNPGRITNAATNIEQQVLPLLWGFAPHAQKLSPKSFASHLEALASASRESIRQLTVQRNELASKLADLVSQADTQTARLEALAAEAAGERAQAAATVAKLEQIFAEKETERAAAFNAALEELRRDFTTFDMKVRADSEALLNAIDDQKTQAARIVQVVGNIGVTGNYQQIANAEGKQANFWRWATIVFFTGGITVAAATFIKFWGQPFSPDTALSVVIRLLYAIAISAPAWYTAKESARHRTTSDRARQTELELASLGPFIELMPEEKKVQLREQLTPYYFGKSVETHNSNSPLDAGSLKSITELFKVIRSER